MFEQLLSQCWENYKESRCCHNNENICNCYHCLYEGFYSYSDEYDCEKKLLFYVLNYGASYISEFYHYLSNSQLLNNFKGNLNVLSLGCGFSPDYYALSKYIFDNNLDIQLSHFGIDISDCWDKARLNQLNIKYDKADLTDITNPLSFQGYDLITVNKIFSSLYRPDQGDYLPFIQNIGNAINTSMQKGSTLVFNDINSRYKGRDAFDMIISRYFENIRRYYTGDPPGNPPYIGKGWISIPQRDIIYSIGNYEHVSPYTSVTKTVFFEYRK